ncbi:hypothetical protein DIC66_17790 [Rhodoferax lacus]|uniref:Uncharacterized protein n=1 Tax=Rhodoferax lacus TaxID=2184758 RepID=A0A3E1R7Z7_9BURK|nr:anti-phage defense-associated sirtuin Dsr1 [Rhodoferax lacus]RFO95486.1 hypothetical protein DIC66_17790 [Rhodoferax lacus]
MQLIRNGPDIPERLLEAHEDGRVVFFCGAGISYPAGLPGFGGLVKRLYSALTPTPTAVQQAAIKSGLFDTAIGLLESDIVNGRETVRRHLASVLTATSSAPSTRATHDALLTLSQSREGRTRLITTNFDRLFEEVISARALQIEQYRAPLLPVPKNRWDGLVYLHGLLDAKPTPGTLDRLVISSGDFGLAYLTERWAARFVSELFRSYTVCFVGYSINDPVLRYMTDALAADRLLGESSPEMFAFGSFSKGKESERTNEWKAKNVTPILYREHQGHSYLHKTLRAWADTYRDGVRGKESIVVASAIGRPLASTKQDDFVGRVLWALSDPGGLPAQRFADMDPVPALDWLEPLSNERFLHADLARFGVVPAEVKDDKLAFSLLQRPTPYSLAPLMSLVGRGASGAKWDAVMHQLARWLTRHLDDSTLLIWMAKRGGQLHEEFVWLIERKLEELDKLERDSDTTKLQRIRFNAPSAVPRPMMRTLWRLLLTGRVRLARGSFDLYRWREHFTRDGMTASLRLALREALTPCISIREPFHWASDDDEAGEPKRIKDLVEWELELATDHVRSVLRDLPHDGRWADALPGLLEDFTALLRDAMDLRRELGDAEDRSDHSYVLRPSISDHGQNNDFNDWTELIELARDAWLAMAERSPEQARIAAEAWMAKPYPVFHRLAFFAAAQSRGIPTRLALDWLLSADKWWLWSVETQREAMRLLVALVPLLDATMLAELERAILTGPPREMVRDDIDPAEWDRFLAREVWLLLAKMAATGVELGHEARQRLDALSGQYPAWQLDTSEREEFPVWSEGAGWGGDIDPWRSFTPMPHSRSGVLNYLREHPDLKPGQQDDWKERCLDSFQATAYALCQLAHQGVWPAGRWKDALQVWSDEKLRDRSWHLMAPVLSAAPPELFAVVDRGIGWWLRQLAKTFQGHNKLFLELAHRLLQLSDEDDGAVDDPVLRAINDPIGHVTEALLSWWYRQSLEDGQGLNDDLKPIFTALCDTQVRKFRHGRVLLAANVITLFRVDGNWTKEHLLPLFDWQRSDLEARAAWEGFLWSPRLYRPLMEVLKPAFLDTANHYAQLGDHGKQYAAILTFAALDPGDNFNRTELAHAIRTLPAQGLHEAADALVLAQEAAGEQREEYWRNRVQPFWEKVWPNSNDAVSRGNAEPLARLCISAGAEFASAVASIGNWLRTVEHPDFVVHRLSESGLARQFPPDALQFLDAILHDQPRWAPRELRKCLDDVVQVAPDLRQDQRWLRLDQYARAHGD